MGAELIIEVDDKQAQNALKKLNTSLDKSGKKAERSFGKASSAIGGVATGVVGLTASFAALSAAGVAAFTAIAAEGVNLASQLEQARVTFTNIFEGDAGAAEAFLGNLNKQALELGVNFTDLSGFAKSLAPDTSSVEQFERLTKAAVTLEKSDPDKTFDDVRVAIEEALSGNFVSLQERFDLPKSAIQNIKNLQGELGAVEGIIAGLEAEFERTGQNIESFSDTFAASQDRINARFNALQVLLGEPILDALKEEFSLFDDLLAENSDTLGLVAQQLGDVAANIVDFIGTGINEFLADIDFSKVQELATAFFELVEKGRLIVDLLINIGDSTPNDSIDFLIGAIEGLIRAFDTAGQIIALVKAEFAAIGAEINNLVVGFKFLASNLGLFGEEALSIEEASSMLVDSNEAFNNSLRESVGIMDESNQRLEENTKRQEERTKALDKDTSAELERANAVLQGKNALQEQEKAAQEAAEAQAEIDEKRAKSAEESQKRLDDIFRKSSEKRIDDEIKASQKREDIARDSVEAIEDIFRKQGQAISDAATDLSRQEEDIARKGARDRKQIEQDSANQRIEIERNFRQQLKQIQSQFNQEADEAERNNDAQAFIRAVRSRDQQVEAATVERDTSVKDAARNADEQRAELAKRLSQEVEDAKIANSRKLEDLQLRLNRELEEQSIKNQRELEQEAIKDQRLAEQRATELARELDEFDRKEVEKQAKLNESLEKQFDIITAAKEREIELERQSEAEKTAITQREVDRRADILAQREREAEQSGSDDLPFMPGRRERREFSVFGSGGRPTVGEPAIVGDRGPEVFVPDSAGTIIPNDAIFSPPVAQTPQAISSQSTVTNNPTFNLAESMFTDPVARRNLTNFVLGVLAETV